MEQVKPEEHLGDLAQDMPHIKLFSTSIFPYLCVFVCVRVYTLK